MIQATCIQKFKKNNRIYGYRLKDSKGNIKDVYAEQLKTAIKNQQITIINLTLTSDNRLIDTIPNAQPQKSQVPQISDEEQKIKNMVAKAKLLGFTVKEIPTFCNHKCILISKSNTEHIVYIPDDVTRLNEKWGILTFTDHIQELQGTIKVIGGYNLQDASYMFCECKAKSLELSYFNTNNVTNMRSIFAGCQAQSIDLSSFDTSKVNNMCDMFFDCQAQSLDLSSFNTSNVTIMTRMFAYRKVQSLELSSFDTHNVTDMNSMFEYCQAQSIDLSSFDTRNVTDMNSMFAYCKVQSIDLSSFNTSKVTDMNHMFDKCQAQIKATDPKILEEYKNR